MDRLKPQICWVITGAGHFLRESVALLPEEADVYLTRAAVEVCARYGVSEHIAAGSRRVLREVDYSSAPIIYFSMGRYSRLIIAPATANTVAKCALGIADSLASSFFAQATKSGVECAILPTDVAHEMTSVTPSGKRIMVKPRALDLKNMEMLARLENVVLLRTIADLAAYLEIPPRNAG